MPVYVYRCDACGATFERKQSVTEGPLTDCPECDGHVRRVIQPIGIVFKGSGFYVTDHRSHSSTTESASSSSSSDTASKAGNGHSESKSDSKP
jgi:putative FmdB family regulatory protein